MRSIKEEFLILSFFDFDFDSFSVLRHFVIRRFKQRWSLVLLFSWQKCEHLARRFLMGAAAKQGLYLSFFPQPSDITQRFFQGHGRGMRQSISVS